jgi:broad specificity phosphatase PhoE
MRNRLIGRGFRAAALLALLPWLCAAMAQPSEAVWAALEEGGQVVLMRHTITTPGFGDPAGMRLDDCGTQRNLTDEGRGHARRIGDAFRTRNIKVERVLASPWCRCVETARLAFGGTATSAALGNLFGRPENRAEQVRAMTHLVVGWRGTGNLVLVSHGSTILALTGVSLDMGELVVVKPEGERFVVTGRLMAAAR